MKEEDGVTIKIVIGDGSPIHIEADVKMWDMSIISNESAFKDNRYLY
ncbi:hypothetical protein [Chengkuizengella axinellae]|uniref:Uncharacterized protein n=1 Tax=Chengkuizengella axinellae TaxID=3064388 RepID=A0ABT9J5C9_9BACL|nr:hypothetical protein [Chengkuizengella sp. 2205SS18-9]MDP5276688.1 hypothetical protein [Chengkuizengella sp. 2205SS18-9]